MQSKQTILKPSQWWLPLMIGLLAMLMSAASDAQTASPTVLRTKKIVFLAGKKSHGPGEHEYEKVCRLLARSLETSPNLKGYHTEVHLYGWPEDPKTLDDADAIVVYADGSDHNEADHPLLVGNRLAIIQKQMKRGCGLVLLHYATFAPVKRGGPEYLDWAGGYFDYETGSAANHWFSKINTLTTTLSPATPAHPISNGVIAFPLRDEYYYNMRFQDRDPRFVPILNMTIDDIPLLQTVAWAVQRKDGGRGFAFTGGHPYANWQNDNMRRMVLNAIVWAAKGEVPPGGVQSTVSPDWDTIHALILTGYHHPAHDWRTTTPALQEILGRDSRIQTTVWEDPEKLATEDLSRYDVLVQNYCNYDRPSLSSAAREKLLRYVRNGGGLLIIHFANGAWRDWPDYYGRLARRVWVDDKSGHDAYGPFTAHITHSDNLLTQGIADFGTTDELYFHQQGDLPIDPLVTAKAKTTGQEEPLAFAYTEGQGRIFQTLMGHDANALRTPAHAEIIRRAAAWAAKREVLPQPVQTSPQATAPAKVVLSERNPAGRFGNALNPQGVSFAAPGKAIYQEPPLTVECWAKLNGRDSFNILVANSPKESPKHWEVYTTAGTGNLCAFLPGVTPPNIDSGVNIVDEKWHYVAMTMLPERVRLYVDGKMVKDQEIGSPHQTPAIGPLWFGCYPPHNLGCDGLLDEVRISKIAREIRQTPTAPFAADADTIGLWHFDKLENGRFADASLTKNAAQPETRAQQIADARPLPQMPRVFAPLPHVNAKTSVNWAEVGNDKGGMRYSLLTQINKSNVKSLKPAWVFHGGDAAQGGSTIECTPIVVDGVMYLTTVKLSVVALDAATGKEIWRFDSKAGGVNRGVAYWSDGKPNGLRRILVSFTDGNLYSLDALTGKLDADFGKNGIVDLRAGIERDISKFGYGATSAPMVFDNRVILGFLSSEGGPGSPGDIRAFDTRTGKEVWRFHTVPRPGEVGNDTWEGDSWKERPGVNPWSGFTLDTKHGILFCGTGSAASDFYGADRHGSNLFANCTLALDARTGKRIWHFQEVHHDLWDHDNPCPPVVCQVKRNGKTIEAVAQPTKTGFIFVFDRLTGKPLFPIREVPATPSDVPGEQAWATQPEPVLPPPLSPQTFTEYDLTNISPEAHESVLKLLKGYRYGKPYIPPSVAGTVVAPGFHGGATWSGASFDPTTNLLYVNTNNTPYICTVKPNGSGGYDFQGYNYFNDPNGYPASKPPWGNLTAVDLNTGKFAWRITLGEFPELTAKGLPPTGTENFGGTIVTEGGLVFIGGTKDEKFHAFDKATGKMLWDYKLEAGGYATPCTYMVNGKQYVVIACGGGGKLRTKSGDSYIAFALP